MWSDWDRWLVVISFLVPLIGLCGVIAARLRFRRSRHLQAESFVIACFAIVGVISVLLMRECNGCWLAFGTTMPLMAVGATLDLTKSPNPAPF